MRQTDLKILLHEGEGSMLEYKESFSSSLARELVAFANSAGGKIILGVRDDGTVAGMRDSNDLRAKIQDLARNCDPPVKILVEPTTFLPNPAVRAQAEAQGRDQVTQQAGTKLALSRHQVEILAKCVEDQPLVALLVAVGRADRTKFRNQVLAPLLTAGWLEMTIPDKPRSSKQKYRTTELGLKVLRERDKDAS